MHDRKDEFKVSDTELTSGRLCRCNWTLGWWLGSLRHCLRCRFLGCRRLCFRTRRCRRELRTRRLSRWHRNLTKKLICKCAIILAVYIVVLHPRTIPEHKSTHTWFVTDLLKCEEKKNIEFSLINNMLPITVTRVF